MHWILRCFLKSVSDRISELRRHLWCGTDVIETPQDVAGQTSFSKREALKARYKRSINQDCCLTGSLVKGLFAIVDFHLSWIKLNCLPPFLSVDFRHS